MRLATIRAESSRAVRADDGAAFEPGRVDLGSPPLGRPRFLTARSEPVTQAKGIGECGDPVVAWPGPEDGD